MRMIMIVCLMRMIMIVCEHDGDKHGPCAPRERHVDCHVFQRVAYK